jgi:hypothetical protein
MAKAKLIGLETREVRSVTLELGEQEIPAKLYARSLLPQNMATVQQSAADARTKGRDEERINRQLSIAKKKFEQQLADAETTVEDTEATAAIIEEKEAALTAIQESLQGIVDEIENWCLEAVQDIDLVRPRADLSEDELTELSKLEEDGKLETDNPLVEKVPFNLDVMRELCGDVRVGGFISFAPLNFFSAVVKAASVKKKT